MCWLILLKSARLTAIEAADFMRFTEKVVWAEAWYHKASGKIAFRTRAKENYNTWNLKTKQKRFAWSNVRLGTQLLMFEVTSTKKYAQHFKAFMNIWLPTGTITYTPLGLAHGMDWGPLRLSANFAFMALLARKLGVGPITYEEFAKQQIGYMLGDTGRSFVTNFGVNPPVRIHHRSSSCPDRPEPCDVSYLGSPEPNKQVLEGALVGGPDINDNYIDDRTEYKMTEVAIDYNAGFQSAIAGLLYHKNK
uniref:Endoglucanase n=1 Tax=Saccoglossus kowalevskii TaxID=10224 RepID=A0ABM0MKJ0_SACKO|nr:PREDICTED: endoglucanase-like [Saccoglossus kowalevskii]